MKKQPKSPIVPAFIDFVNSQDPNKRINNGTWQTCAVGEFSRENGYDNRLTIENGLDDTPVARLIRKEHGVLYSNLNRSVYDTYGKFQKALKRYTTLPV